MKITKPKARAYISAFVVFLLGIILLLTSQVQRLPPWAASLMNSLGALFVGSVALALIFEAIVRSAFVEEILGYSDTAQQVRSAGISGVSASFFDGVGWDRLFDKSQRIRIINVYGRTWRTRFLPKLEAHLRKKATSIAVLMPDPENTDLVYSLSRQLGYLPDHVKEILVNTTAFYKTTLGDKYPGKVEIYYSTRNPGYSCVLCDSEAIFVPYKQRPGYFEIPTITIEKGGHLFDFFSEEWDWLTKEGIRTGETRAV